MFFKSSFFCLLFITSQFFCARGVFAKNSVNVIEHAEGKIRQLEECLEDPVDCRVHNLQVELIVAALHVVAADEFIGRTGNEASVGLPDETLARMQRVLREALAAELRPREMRAVRNVLSVMEAVDSAPCEQGLAYESSF